MNTDTMNSLFFFSLLSFIFLLSFSPIAYLISILALLKEWKYCCTHFLDNFSNQQHFNDYKLKTCFCWTSGDSHSSYLHLDPCDNILVRYEIDFSFPRTRQVSETESGTQYNLGYRVALSEIARSI